MKYKPYAKVVDLPYAICAIYEPHPFRSNVIYENVPLPVHDVQLRSCQI